MIQLGALKAYTIQALLSRETKNAKAKGKQKGKQKKNNDFKPTDKYNPSEGTPSSKKEKNNKFENDKWSYYNR